MLIQARPRGNDGSQRASVLDVKACALLLTDCGQQLHKPVHIDIEGLAALDAFKLDGAEFVPLVLVFSHHADAAVEGAVHRVVGATLDQCDVLRIGRRRTGEVAALLDQHLFRTKHLGELAAEPLAGVHRIQFHMAEGVARNFLPLGFHLGHDAFHAGAFADEDVHAIVTVHHGAQTGGLFLKVDLHLGNVDAVHVPPLLAQADAGHPVVAIDELAVLRGGGRGEPAAVPPHHLMDDEHAGIRVVL